MTWEEVELLSLSDGGMQNGVFYEVSRKGSGIPLINVGDMYTKVPIASDNLELFAATDDEIKRFAVRDGDLFFTRSSVVPSGIAYCNWYKKTEDKPVVFDSHVIRFKTNVNKVVPMFLYLQCVSPKARSFFIANAKTATMTTIDQTILGKCPIDLPPLPEQRRIAAVLSDTDELIAALEKLIAKKRNIKQGAMQELLTGKRRLPGFSGEWVERPIDYYGDFASGNGFPLIYQGKKAGDYPFYKVSDFSNIGNEYELYLANNYISQPVANTLNCNIIPCGSIVFAKIGAAIFLERKRQNKHDCCIDNNMMAFTVNPEGNSKYLMYLFQTIKFGSIVTATALPSLSGKQIGAIVKEFPPTLTEQTAIAAILSDMDAEIDALTAKLTKIKQIKQGMMSELLTGRIRLLEQEQEQEAEAVPVTKVIEMPKRKPETKTAKKGGHNQQFDDAVMIAGIVNALYSDEYPPGRKRIQKCLYFLRRHQDESTAAFKKKAAGPYADEVRYKGGEPIARNARYIVTKTVEGKGTTFARGSNINQALGYIESWNKQDDINWVAYKLKYKKTDDLELLATVDMAVCDLQEAGIAVSVAAIKHLIATNEEWKVKLKTQTFSDANIARAIQELQLLLLIRENADNGKND